MIEIAGEVIVANIEEHALDEKVDELFEEPVVQVLVTFDELDRAEDVVLFFGDPGHQPLVLVHGWVVRPIVGDLLVSDGKFRPPIESPSPAPSPRGRAMAVSAYILIQTEVGKAAEVAAEVRGIDGVASSEDVTGPYDVIARAEANSVDELGKMVVSRVQMIGGITRTLTCPVVHL